MSSKNKSTIFSIFYKDFQIAVIAGLLVLVGIVWLGSAIILPKIGNKEAALLLAFENEGKGRMFQGEVIEGMTILDALITSSEAGEIKLRYVMEENKNKITIMELNGYYASLSPGHLAFYLNSRKVGTEEIHSVLIKPGDKITVKLE